MRKNREIERHLDACEFCEAEVAFYKHYPQTDETPETAQIPQPLYELALALLGGERHTFSALNSLFGGNENLKLEKAL